MAGMLATADRGRFMEASPNHETGAEGVPPAPVASPDSIGESGLAQNVVVEPLDPVVPALPGTPGRAAPALDPPPLADASGASPCARRCQASSTACMPGGTSRSRNSRTRGAFGS